MTREWRQQGERSTPFMMRLLVRSALLLGRTAIRLALWPIAGYFYLTHPQARAASRDFLVRCRPTGGAGAASVLRHFHTFASVSLDRVYLLSGRTSALAIDTQYGPQAREHLMSGRGCILVVAHFGSFEALRVPAVRRRARAIRIVLDRAVGRMALALLDELDANLADGIIDAARPGPDIMLDVKQALDAGDIVGIMGDRASGDERAVTVDFLGGQARFPAGPWLIAATLDVPIVLGFGVLRGSRHYDCRLELFSDGLELPRATREASLQAVVQRYARRLEQAVRASPYNWFNFYDYWLSTSGISPPRHEGSMEHARFASRH